ncbi:hypothetical protein JCM10213_007258 [Rhodosporidiobolus nylandii]
MFFNHIHPVPSHHSHATSLPRHRPSVTSLAKRADKGARSWFESSPGHLKHGLKSNLLGMFGEFLGTTLFLFFALGGAQVASMAATKVDGGSTRADAASSVASSANTSNLLYIAFAFGYSLACSIFIFGPISGALCNPSVSLGLWLAGAMKPVRAVLLTIAQLAGGIAASALVYGLLPGGFDTRTTLSTDCSIVRGLFIEAVLTLFLMLSILFLAVEKNESAPVAAFGIGLTLFCAELVGVNFTGGSLNPARSLGPSVLNRNFQPYFWIYVVGPFLGAAVAAGLYRLFKVCDYRACLAEHACPSPAHVEKPLPMPSAEEYTMAAPPSQRPSVVSIEKGPFEPRNPRTGLRTMSSATTLTPGMQVDRLERIEGMLAQLLGGRAMPVEKDVGELHV